MTDYFPLVAGKKYVYRYSSSEFDGCAEVSVVVLSEKTEDGVQTATVRMTTALKGHETATVYNIVRDASGVTTYDGIVVGGRKEFPLPVKEGAEWDEYPDANEIVSVTDKLRLGETRYEGCLKVLTLIAGGEAGTATRYYAPDVGYVHEVYHAEDLQAEVSLLRVEQASPLDMELKRTANVAGPDDMGVEGEMEDVVSQEIKIPRARKGKPKSCK
ncbi:MAG: hypothetical protein PHW69_08285 [Elusimicrobiaceae bacterium]|nr:hypothetical protein [Elusimicrobiaceae bacterium]